MLFRILILSILTSCTTDVSIMKKQNDTPEDSSQPIPQDTDETGDLDTSVDSGVFPNSGITGYTNYRLRQVACPPCVGEAQEITVTFSAKFHEPITDNHTNWIPNVGTCIENIYMITPSTVPTSVGNDIIIASPAHTFSAQQTNVGTYYTDQIWEAQYQRDEAYEVQTDAGDFNVTSSHGFDFIEPYTLLWVDPSYAYDTAITKSVPNVFTWGPTSIDHIFVITIAVYSWDGSQFLGRVDCAGDDSGYMAIPGSYFQPYPAGSLTAVHLVRHRIGLSETNINNSYVENHTEWEVIGTGHVE